MVMQFIGGLLLVALLGLVHAWISRRDSCAQPDDSRDDMESQEDYMTRMRFQEFSRGEDSSPIAVIYQDNDDRY